MGFVLGAFVGSFLNMVIYRLPRNLSFTEPKRSICPNCKHPLYSADLMPIFSWIFLCGKCRYCRKPVPSRYFWVEIITAILFAAIWNRYLTDSYEPIRAGFYAAFAACLVAVIYIDWELYIIPDELNAVLLILAFTFHGIDHSMGAAISGALWGWGLLFGVALLGRIGFGKDAMGDGDTKMMRGVGALIGPWLLIGNFGIAVVSGLVGGLLGMAAEKRSKAIPVERATVQNAVAAGVGTLAVEAPLPMNHATGAAVADGKTTFAAANDDADPSAEPAPRAIQAAEEADYAPTPIPVLILSGVWYLFCLDIVALLFPPLKAWIDAKIPSENVEEEDDWKPSATTIPFGPYLAVGALVCMLFATAIEHAIKAYFHAG